MSRLLSFNIVRRTPILLSTHQPSSSSSSIPPTTDDVTNKALLRTLYRKCLKVSSTWTEQEHTYAAKMHKLEAFLRPSFKQHLLISLGGELKGVDADITDLAELLTASVVLRRAFEYRLPTDSVKVQSWCIQAAFAFIRRCHKRQEELVLISPWALVTEKTFTALDASLLAAYMHYHHNFRRYTGKDPLQRSYEDVMRQQVISSTMERKSLDSFTEGVLVQVDALVEKCRSAIPQRELLRPELHAKLIVRSVIHALRFEIGLVAIADAPTPEYHSLDMVLKNKVGSHWVVGVLVVHILACLGLRGVMLCSADLPLVCVYGKSKSKLQFCVDLLNTELLNSAESMKLFIAASMEGNMSVVATDNDVMMTSTMDEARQRYQQREGSKLAAVLLHRSESPFTQASFVLGNMMADPSMHVDEYNTLKSAKAFVRRLQDRYQ